ncbi:MAG: tetrathionate reductase family octaheme c-type cytochrome [Caldithrix sp.]|nr:tetrathionate reductase family octaheme c-type cytochrome [Caldithrix sp.]
MFKSLHTILLIAVVVLTMPLLLRSQSMHQEVFQQPYDDPRQVTAMCLECHDTAAEEIMQNIHWTWVKTIQDIPGHENAQKVGKKNLFNNFCINVKSNWPRCTSCHIGYGWKDESFDFEDENNVDCLVCHDNTATYKKTPTGAGMPADTVNLQYVAQNVGNPTRENCGKCHFFGGGGENVKHGDLDLGLIKPERDYDVHMGSGMVCQDCHITEAHQIKGQSMAVYASSGDRILCTDCHGNEPHNSELINGHGEKVSCQTCHIPQFAKDQPTKMYWDWSTAGKDSSAPKDQYGKMTYHKKKGSFKWGKNVEPEYYWYDGTSQRYLLGDTFKPDEVVSLNHPNGQLRDDQSKLVPFKVHRGKQIYDDQNNYLIVPKLYGGFWKHYDWAKAAEEGMESVDLEYSGSYAFVETEMFWKVNHMVSPKEQALKCNDCHGMDSRMDWKALGYQGDQMYPKNRE